MLESLKQEDLQFQELSPEEKQARGILARLTGPIASFTKGTRNGRKYSDKLWEKAFDSPLVKEMFKNGGLPGELQHPENRSETDPTKIAIMMPEPPKKDSKGHLVASVDILDTPCGQIAYQLGKYGFKFGISSRGEGDLITDFSGEESVDPDTYTLNAFDLVLIPACEDARLQFNESLNTKNSNKLRTILSEALANASETDRKIMEEALDELDIDDNWRFVETYHDEDIYYDPDTKKYIVGYSDNYTVLNSVKNAREYIDRFVTEQILTEEQVGREETKSNEMASTILSNKPENTEDTEKENTTEVSVNINNNTEKENNPQEKVQDIEIKTEEEDKEQLKEYREDDEPKRAPWDTDFYRLDTAYNHNFKQFDDMEADSGVIRDFIDDLEAFGKDYDIYEHKTDPGCTIFFQESLNEAFEGTIEDIDIESIAPQKKDIDRANGLKFRGKSFHGNGSPWASEASKMAKLIQDPIKLVRRAKAVASIWGIDDSDPETNVWEPFRKRLAEFGFTSEQIRNIRDSKLNESLNEDISWEDLNGTEQAAAEAAIAEIKDGAHLEDAVHGACAWASSGTVEPEYEDEDWYGEEADYTKVLDYVRNHEQLTEDSENIEKPEEFSAIELRTLSEDDLETLLDNAPTGSIIHNIYENWWTKKTLEKGKQPTESIVKKCQGYKQNYFAPVPTKNHVTWWEVSGSEKHIYDLIKIILGKSKYYTVSDGNTFDFKESINEDKYTRDELFDKFGTDDLDIINAGNEETVELKEGSIPDFAKILDSGYCNKAEWPEIKKEQLNKYKKDYKNVKCTLQKSDTKGLRMWITYINDTDIAADDSGAIVEQLQKVLKRNKSLEDKVKALQEKVSVGYAKEIDLQEEIENYKQQLSKLSEKTKEIKVLTEKLAKAEKAIQQNRKESEGNISNLNESIVSKDETNKKLKKNISDLNEAVDRKNSKIRSLNEQISEYKDQLSSKDNDIEQLKEQYETGQKDLEQLRSKYSKKLEQQNQIIEKYQRVAKNSVKRYIESQAVRLGVKSDEIVNRLPKNYSFNDIDTICEDLQEYKFNMSNLPFGQFGLNENLKVTAKNINKGLIEANPEDEITDYDLKIAEAFL